MNLQLLLVHEDSVVVCGGCGERTLAGSALERTQPLTATGLGGQGRSDLVRDQLHIPPLIQEEDVHHWALGLDDHT